MQQILGAVEAADKIRKGLISSEQLVRRCMLKQIDHRWNSMSEILEELRARAWLDRLDEVLARSTAVAPAG